VLLELGQVPDALKHYQEALRINRQQADSQPRNHEARRNLAVAYNKLGDVSLKVRQPAEAAKYYKQGLDISQRLAAADPRDVQMQHDLAFSHERLGKASHDLGHVADALEHYRRQLEINQKLAAADAEDAETQRDVSVAYMKLWYVSHTTGELQDALAYGRQALEISQKLAAAHPHDVEIQQGLAFSHYCLGKSEQQRFEYAAAVNQYKSGVDVLERMAKEGQKADRSQREADAVKRGDMAYCQDALVATGELEALLKKGGGELPKLLPIRIQELARKGDLPAVVTATDKLRDLTPRTAENLYSAARGYCLAALIVMQPPKNGILSRTPVARELSAEEQAKREGYLDRAATTLRQAVAVGFKDLGNLEQNPDLNPIRERTEYRKLVAQLKGS
jgi:tetratricopeptide (TPR) repeat protein